MSLAFDENGRPFIILREQDKKKRVKGLEAHKVSNPGHNLESDQHHGSTHCRQSPQDLTRSQRHGQDARQVSVPASSDSIAAQTAKLSSQTMAPRFWRRWR